MRHIVLAALLTATACGTAPTKQETILVETPAAAASFPEIEIEYTKFVLPNGLTLLVHEDHKAPVVAVNVWYHVGSKNEHPGKTGFAHLFEHLMFQGSENLKGEFFEPLERAGATDMNGTTNVDRTNYFETVPTASLDLALWLESDRMGHFVGSISQERLDEQRGVVQNEKRQGENQPYGKVWDMFPEKTYPVGHPYSWSVIGSMPDLNAASLDDVKSWFAGYYGAGNAVLSIAGDITAEEAHQKVLKYFGDIPAGPPVERHGPWVAPMTERRELDVFDQVPQERVYYVYNVPQFGSPELERLRLTAAVMGWGKTSRLYKRLVYEDQLASHVNFYVDENEIGSQLIIMADAKPGVALADVEAAIEEELTNFVEQGPTSDELLRARMSYFADRIARMERVGGFGGKSDILARNEVYLGDAGAYKQQYEEFKLASAKDVQATAQKWIHDGVFVARVHPNPETSVAKQDVDRSTLPDVGAASDLTLPKLERATLANGMNVVLAQRHDVPIVQMRWVAPAGSATDFGGKAGTAKLAMDLMDEGTKSHGSLELAAELERLGASLSSGASLDDAGVNMSVLSTNLDAGIALFAEVITEPAFAPDELQRQRNQQLVAIAQEKARPMAMAQRLLGPALFGDAHPYGMPWTGSGTVDDVSSITRDDIVTYHQHFIRPDKATIILVGDTTLQAVIPVLEASFGKWKQDGDAKTVTIPKITASTTRVLLIDKPGAEQSFIVAGNVFGPRSENDPITADVMNQIIGGSFMSRINMNLREDKHWSYGARSFLFDTRNQQAYAVFAQVQSDKTKESIVEIQKELNAYLTNAPVTEEELARAKSNTARKVPGRNETIGRLLDSVDEIVRFNLPDDYYNTYVAHVEALTTTAIEASARTIIQPSQMVWIVVGDLSHIEDGVRDLKLAADVEVVKQ